MDVDKKIIFLTIYVDDILLFYNCKEVAGQIKRQLMKNFKMKDLGPASQYIGLQITQRDEGIAIDQSKYIESILQRFGMYNCKPVCTAMESGATYLKSTEKNVIRNVPYREAIGCLLYLSQGTRPDICYSVHTLSRYNAAPTMEHWKAIKRILRYLQCTKNIVLFYNSDINGEITGYCDSDWASCIEERKSCTGYIFMFQNAAIS